MSFARLTALAACADNGGCAPDDLVDGRGAPERVDGARMTGAASAAIATPMALLRALIAGPPADPPCPVVLPAQAKPDGGLKDMMARVTMLAMHKDGRSPCRRRSGGRTGPGPSSSGRTPTAAVPGATTLDEVRPLDLRTVVRGTGKLWNEFVARHHYLGHTTLVGAQMRYAVHDRDGGPIAMLGSAPAGSSPRGQLHRMDRNCARRTSGRQSEVPHPARSKSPTTARTSSPSSAAACPRTGPRLQHHPR